MTFLTWIACLSLLLSAPVSSGQNLRPPSQYHDYGACPFECCTYRRWVVIANTVFYRQRSTTSGVAFRVKKGDHVIGLTGVVITLKPGKAVVKKSTTIGINKRKTQVKPGDVLYLLHYMGEGVYKIWFRGRIYEDQMPTAPDLITKIPIDTREKYLKVLSEPEYVWWVKVRNSRGQIGWSKEDENLDDMDSCA